VTLRELVTLLEDISGQEAKIQKLPMQAGDVEITYADISKASEKLGFAPCTSIREGLEKFITWFEQNSTWKTHKMGEGGC
jgi:UDP-glucuronate 4-epimerase